jgi:hypothetical protein
MYTFFKRTAPYPDLMTFDCPDANTTNVRRSVSNTPLQALTTLNSGTFAEAARALGKRIAALESGDDSTRMSELFRAVLLRAPSGDEIRKLSQLLEEARTAFRADEQAAKSLGGDPENASWTTVARTLLNTDEFITRD